MGLIHDKLTDSKGEVVCTDNGREARISYRTACQDYSLGFALPHFMVASLLGLLLASGLHLPGTTYRLTVLMLAIFTTAGFAFVVVGYTVPVWFYELVEERPEL